MKQEGFYVGEIYPEYDFYVTGASYTGRPVDNTIMFVTKKVEHLVQNLVGHHNCLVFAEVGIVVSDEIARDNAFVFSEQPQREYIYFANMIYDEKRKRDINRNFTLTEAGYYIGENVQIGKNAYIEPGCVIGHDVIIGDDACILANAVIKNAIIGNKFVCNEGALIGTNGFTMAEDENGNKVRIPTLGKVCIGDCVEIGANDNISCGSAGDTIIEDYVKLDVLVHVGHDAHLYKNVEITACGIVGGFTELEERAYMGLNATTRNRIRLGKNCIIGMGATVTKSVDDNITVVGNPARPFEKK